MTGPGLLPRSLFPGNLACGRGLGRGLAGPGHPPEASGLQGFQKVLGWASLGRAGLLVQPGSCLQARGRLLGSPLSTRSTNQGPATSLPVC